MPEDPGTQTVEPQAGQPQTVRALPATAPLVVRVPAGSEVMATLTARLAEAGVRDAAIVSVVGAVDECRISTMPAGDPTADVLTDLVRPFELSGTGEVTDGVPHVHCVLGAEGTALAGHLHSALVRTWFVNVYVLPLARPVEPGPVPGPRPPAGGG